MPRGAPIGDFRRAALPLRLSCLLGLAVNHGDCAAAATAFTVTTCADSGAGSLREILTSASTPTGSIVDLSHLTCSTITLDTGGIFFGQNDLTIIGPGSTLLTVQAGQSTGTGLLTHTSSGTLTISGIKMLNGEKYSAGSGHPRGGCLYSHGNIAMHDMSFEGCRAYSTGSGATLDGGCIYAAGNIVAENSSFSSCRAAPALPKSLLNKGRGGCLFAKGDVTLHGATLEGCNANDYGGQVYSKGHVSLDHSKVTGGFSGSKAGGIRAYKGFDCAYSSITGNQTISDDLQAVGGGIYTSTPVTIQSCLIAYNAAGNHGGIFVVGGTGTFTMVNSTVSNNRATHYGAGITSYASMSIANSTIVDNRAQGIINDPNYYKVLGSGIEMYGAINLTLQSSIVAHNGPNAIFTCDISGGAGATIVGSDNIVMFSILPLPHGTISDDPLIGPLRDHGGPTRTHALLAGSPAIDAGNSVVPTQFDQRGSPHRRVLGARQDIGAYETDPDQLFADGFESL